MTAAAGMHPSAWAARLRLEPGPGRVLQILADLAGSARNYCWPGAAFIAFKCRRSLSWVRQQIELLEAAGLVTAEQRGVRRTNVYVLHVGAGDMSCPDKVEGQGEFGFLAAPAVRQVAVAEAADAGAVDRPANGNHAAEAQPAARVTASRLSPDPTMGSNQVNTRSARAEEGRSEEIDPYDPRAELEREGLPILQALAGRSLGGSKGLMARLLQEARDDAGAVLMALRRGQALRPADPVPWLMTIVRKARPPEVPQETREQRSWRLVRENHARDAGLAA